MGLQTVLFGLKKTWKSLFCAPKQNSPTNVSPQVKCLHREHLSLRADKCRSFPGHYLKEEFTHWWSADVFYLAHVCIKIF